VTTSGSSSSGLAAEREPCVYPRGVRCLFRVLGFRLRPLALSPARPLQEGDVSFESLAGPPFVRFLLPRTQLQRVPLLRHEPPRGGPCGTRAATLPSVPSSGFLPLSTVSAGSRLARGLLDPAVRRDPRCFAAFFHAARVTGASLQSFPFPRSRTRSRGPRASLRVRVRLPPAQGLQELHGRFPLSRRLFARRAHPEVNPGRMSRDDGSLRSLGRPPRRTRKCTARSVHFPQTLGSPVSGRHARFEALLPPGVRSETTSSPWPG